MQYIDINLPKKKNTVLIAIAFDHGYFDEDDTTFGLTHLIEHYLISILKNTYNLSKQVSGEVSDTYFALFFEFSKKEYFEFLKYSIDDVLIKISKTIDVEILKNEKKRIEIEIEDKYSDIFQEMSKSIEKQIIAKPKFLRRDKLLQIKNIKKITKNQCSEFINMLSKKEKVVLIGFNNNVDNIKKLNKNIFTRKYKTIFTKKRDMSFESKNKILKKAHNFAIAFKGFDMTIDKIDRFALSFLASKIYENFNKKAQKFGAYNIDYKNITDQTYGIVWFCVNSYSKIHENIENIFYKTIEDIISSKTIQKEIIKFKKQKSKKIKEQWNDFYGRFDWVFYDIVDSGDFTYKEYLLLSLEKLNLERIIEIKNKVFNKNNSFILRG